MLENKVWNAKNAYEGVTCSQVQQTLPNAWNTVMECLFRSFKQSN